VDYRLAPETRYSGSLDDNYAAELKWAAAYPRTARCTRGSSLGR